MQETSFEDEDMRVAAVLTLLIIAMLAASSSNVTIARSEILLPLADTAN